MALTRITPFATVVEGDQHMADRTVTWAWDEANSFQQEKALAEATRLINRLRFRGKKTVDSQPNQWPRDNVPNVTNGTTPEDIKRACIELAYSLLAGDYSDERYEDQFVRREAIGGAPVTYDGSSWPVFLVNGIPSMGAWTYLAPYLARVKDVKLMRAS